MKSWCVVFLGGIVGLGLAGCEDPGEFTSVSPPGAPVIRTSPDAEPAQAQGEMAAPMPSTTTSEPAPTPGEPDAIPGPVQPATAAQKVNPKSIKGTGK
jgi:hypothetical protein